MKLSTYAKEMGITRHTATRWFHEDRMVELLFIHEYQVLNKE